MLPNTDLPYRDRKPQGAADFYFAINATFRFIRQRLGKDALTRYWQALGRDYLRPVHRKWKKGGLEVIAAYWRAFFAAEPGGCVEVEKTPETVIINVRICPAIAHLRQHGREIVPEFCQHCYFVSEAAAKEADYTVRIRGGAGTCTQTFHRRDNAPPPQKLSAILMNKPVGAPIQNHQSETKD